MRFIILIVIFSACWICQSLDPERLENPVSITSFHWNQRLRAFPCDPVHGTVDFTDLDQDWERFEIIPVGGAFALRSYYHKNHIGASEESVFATNLLDLWEIWDLQKLENGRFLIKNLKQDAYLSSIGNMAKLRKGPPTSTEEFIITAKKSCVYVIRRPLEGIIGAKFFLLSGIQKIIDIVDDIIDIADDIVGTAVDKLTTKGHHSALLIQKGNVFNIIEYGVENNKNAVRVSRDLIEDGRNVKSWGVSLLDGSFEWKKQETCTPISPWVTVNDVAQTMKEIMKNKTYDLGTHNCHVAQESVRYFYGWHHGFKLDYLSRVSKYVRDYRGSLIPSSCNLIRKIENSAQLFNELSYFALYHSEKKRYLSAKDDDYSLPLKERCGNEEIFYFDKRDAWGIVSIQSQAWVSQALESKDYRLPNGYAASDAGLVDVNTAVRTGSAKWDVIIQETGWCFKNDAHKWYLSATYADKARLVASCLSDEIWEIWEVKKQEAIQRLKRELW